MNKSYLRQLWILTFICFSISSTQIGRNIDKATPVGIVSFDTQKESRRILQTTSLVQSQTAREFDTLISRINSVRSKLKIEPLKKDTNLDQILSQWAKVMRTSMTLVSYMQIFGVKDIKVYEFEKIPVAYFSEVIERECSECYIDIYKKIGALIEVES